MKSKKDIRALSKEELRDFFVAQGGQAFRGNQVYEWLWSKSAHTFDEMTNLSKETRSMLEAHFVINHIEVDKMQRSADGTVKNAIKLYDDLIVESVLIPTETRTTACISSQVGCSLDCKFCATARLKKMRNLNPDEIYDQVVAIDQQSRLYHGHKLSNIVFMGMGEPLDNSDNVFKAIDIITDHHGYKLGRRKITVSTSGIVPEMHKIWENKVRLAVSLNASSDEIRNFVMPINKRYPLKELLSVCKEYTEKTSNRVTFEYVLLKGVTDRIEDAVRVHQLVKNIPCKINIIPFNEHPGTEFFRPDEEAVEAFAQKMMSYGYQAIVRKTMGRDIFAACGQLTSKYEGRPETLQASLESRV
ncbi:MAG: 23S rRNA (adenine(2503)-C(2))-methyltransferase RlmN [Flavobacteriaceae bacterium]|nr:23S rRNA (adenine(2503)-C(2))-methyltransferase RlmN [Flavobacteriaceae bacterium]